MAHPARKEKPQFPVVTAEGFAEWYESYFAPEPANRRTPPSPDVIGQMYGYYDA